MSRKSPSQAEWETWVRKPAWNQRELSELCAGLLPGTPNRTDDEQKLIQEATQMITRAVLVKALKAIEPCDATTADRMYDNARFFLPLDAAQWGAQQFPATFPAELLAACNPQRANAGGASLLTTERDTLLALIGALCELAGFDLRKPTKGHAEAKAMATALADRNVRITNETVAKKIAAGREVIAPKGSTRLEFE